MSGSALAGVRRRRPSCRSAGGGAAPATDLRAFVPAPRPAPRAPASAATRRQGQPARNVCAWRAPTPMSLPPPADRAQPPARSRARARGVVDHEAAVDAAHERPGNGEQIRASRHEHRHDQSALGDGGARHPPRREADDQRNPERSESQPDASNGLRQLAVGGQQEQIVAGTARSPPPRDRTGVPARRRAGRRTRRKPGPRPHALRPSEVGRPGSQARRAPPAAGTPRRARARP